MGPRYNQTPHNSGSSEFEMVDILGGELVCDKLVEAQEVEQRTGIRGYNLMGTVVLHGPSELYAEPTAGQEEFVLLQGGAPSGRLLRPTHATAYVRWELATVHEPLSVAIMPSNDFRQLVTLNRELPDISASTEKLRIQAMQRSELRTLSVKPGSFEMLDRQFHHDWPELQKSFIDNQHCVVAVDPSGRVAVRDFARGGSGTYVRRRRQG